jgi:AcrR family transcriptional regulator
LPRRARSGRLDSGLVAGRGRREPISRRERPAKKALSRAAIVKAALEIIDAEGVDRLTMRRLAASLDTGAASLYVYFADIEHLHAAILDQLLGGLDLKRGKAEWDERLVGLLVSYTELLHAKPALAGKAIFTRPSGDNYLGLLDFILALLREGGMEPVSAAWAADVLLLTATAIAAEQGRRDERAGSAREEEELAEVIAAVSPAEYPHLAAASGALLSGAPEERLRWAFLAVIRGAMATPGADVRIP